MARVDRAKSFWKTIRSVSVPEIAREAARPFAFAVVGEAPRREQILDQLFPQAKSGEVLPDRSLVRTFDSTAPDAGFPRDSATFDLVIDAGGGRVDPPGGLHLYSVPEVGDWDRLADRLLDDRSDLALSLARRFPGLRERVAHRIVKETALANAEFAMLSALPGVIPVIGVLLPAGAVGDIFMLTKNQAMMLFRLAAIFGLPLNVSARARDLAPLLANAFGWRAVAREIVGGVPGGVGLVARGTIAYAGTAAVGAGLLKLYQTGKSPTRAQINQYYRDALTSARERVQGIARRITARRPRQIPKG